MSITKNGPEPNNADTATGSHIGVRRNDLTLLYTVVSEQYTRIAEQSPLANQHAASYRKAGINLASHALTLLRLPDVLDRVRQAPYPKLQALLDAIGDAPVAPDDAGDFYVTLPGPDSVELSTRLDEIRLPDEAYALAPQIAGPAPHLVQTPADAEAVAQNVDTEARLHTSTPMELGGGLLPVVLFEPRLALAVRVRGTGQTSEMQVESIIGAGFCRFLPSPTAHVPSLPDWSVRYTPHGLELWDPGGIWARAALKPHRDWLHAADTHGQIFVVYGVKCGVRAPAGRTYTDHDRSAELRQARQEGIVAAARVSWWG
jgi:hypothetical protein